MIKVWAIDFSVKISDPKNLEMEVHSCVKGIDKNNNIVSLNSFKEQELGESDSDDVMFDNEFSNSLLVTFADIVHGNFRGSIKFYNIPDDTEYVVKTYDININGKNEIIIKIYKIEGDKMRIKYSERLPELDEYNRRIEKIQSLTGLPKEIIKKFFEK